jgi:hypothetical protein
LRSRIDLVARLVNSCLTGEAGNRGDPANEPSDRMKAEVSAMRHWATATVSLSLLALSFASAAGAAVSYDPSSNTGFISRGDVIASGGKDALISDPVVAFSRTTDYTLTCTWPDQVQRSLSLERSSYVIHRARTRYAVGSGAITGYSLSSDTIIDAGSSPPVPDVVICWALLGQADDGTPVDLQYANVSQVATLTLFGPNGAVRLSP